MTAAVGEVIARPNQQPTVDIINENPRPNGQQPSDMSNEKENSDNEKIFKENSDNEKRLRSNAKFFKDLQNTVYLNHLELNTVF
ncbi:hypothetical protein WA026_016783 [Henosepilachna vigintioctopunctata]|uniref:Uncharacterized protein n=1 Tax=Henosepilachna vigintioctopunctata TaxID=420089 RepID=A0AAW1V2I5_9CUCU